MLACSSGRATLRVKGFQGRDLRGDPRGGLNRIFISFPGVSFQGHGHRFVGAREGGH